MKLFSLWVVLSGLILSLMAGCGRAPQGRLPKLPEDKTVMLSICEEEQYSQKYLYTKKEVRALTPSSPTRRPLPLSAAATRTTNCSRACRMRISGTGSQSI